MNAPSQLFTIATPITKEEYHIRVAANIELYEGRAYNVFETDKQNIREPSRKHELYLQKNIFRMITDTFVHLSVFEPVKITTKPEQQEVLDDWIRDNDFQEFIKEAFKTASIAGDCICILYKDVDGWHPQIINNQIWEPHFDEYNINAEADVNDLVYEFTIKENDKDRVYKVKKRFEYNKQANQTTISFICTCDKSDEPLEFSQIPKFILDKFGIISESGALSKPEEGKLFFRFENEKSMRDYFGLSDYTENVRAYGENINDLLELSWLVQQKTGNPNMVIPASYLKSGIEKANSVLESYAKNNQTAPDILTNLAGLGNMAGDKGLNGLGDYIARQYLVKGLEYFPVREGETKPEFIQSTSTIPQIETTIDRFKNEAFQDVALPTVLIDGDVKTGQLSGIALQRLMTRTLQKKHAREIRISNFLREIIVNLFELNGQKIEKPALQFGDGIIDNPVENIEIIELKLKLGIISKKQALMELYDITTEEAENRLQEIEDEKVVINSPETPQLDNKVEIN